MRPPPTPKQAPIPTDRVIEYNIGTPPRTDVDMIEENEEPRTFEPISRSQRSFPKAVAESSLWESSPFRPVPSQLVITRYDDAHMEPSPSTQHHETHVEPSPPTQHVPSRSAPRASSVNGETN